MPAQTDNKYDVFYWVEKVIYSCETIIQFNASEKLVINYHAIYRDRVLQNKLNNILQKKLLKLMNKNKL